MAVRARAGPRLSGDDLLERLVAEAEADPETVAVVLLGSRAAGTADAGSDYDLVRVLEDDAYARRAEREGAHLKDGLLDRLYVARGRLEELTREEHWARAGFIGARVVFDRRGDAEELVERLVRYPGETAARIAYDRYDDYLNGFVRSLRSWQKGDELGARLHASDSLASLLKALFALEGRVAPYLDRLRPETLAPLAPQGWPQGEPAAAMLELARTADPVRQQELERRVEELFEARGVRAHAEWGDTLERLKASEF